MANYEATRYNFDGANLQDVEGVNTGIILPWSDSTAPTGFLECDGTAVNRTTYANLFAAIGTTWGVGDGSTTFNVPDLTDRCCVHTSPSKAFATTGGANTDTCGGNISGGLADYAVVTSEMAAHSHVSGSNYANPGPYKTEAGSGNNPASLGNTGSDTAHGHSFSGNFSGGNKSVLQPYLTVMYIIKT
jgi:microcystin-dependent protein